MARKVPFHVNFRTIGKVNIIGDWILYTAVAAASINLLIELRIIQDPNQNKQQFLNTVSCYLSISYFGLDLLLNYLFQCAEATRRNDFFDNSLNTVLADQNSEEYFTNDSINIGIYKLGVNCFENSFFSKSIAQKYLRPTFIRAIIVLLIFLAVALFADNKLLVTILQLALPLTIIQQTVRLFYYKSRVEQIHEYFKRIFAMTPGDKQDHLIIHNVTNYESTLAWACIKLPDNLFKKMNPALSTQWEDIKQRLNIQ